MTLSRQIKKELNKNNVKNSVRTHHGTITVELKSHITAELLEVIKGMETVEAHGSIMDDTRYYTGTSIQFRYEFEPTAEELEKAEKCFQKYSEWDKESNQGRNSFNYHFRKELTEELGPSANIILRDVYKVW